MKTVWNFFLSVALLIIFSYIRIDAGSIPITGQTFALCLLPVINRKILLSLSAAVFYILSGIAGAPVFAGGESGWHVLAGVSGGYISGFIPALIIGHMLYRSGRHLAAFVMINLTVLIFGSCILALKTDLQTAWKYGFVPFLPGAAIKSLLAYLVSCIKNRIKKSPQFQSGAEKL